MKTSQFFILLIIGVLLTAFITNPDRKKHSEKATEILFETNQEDENYGILGGLVSTLASKTVESNIKIKDYYLFSKSYAFSPSRNRKLNLGFGIFGQVLSLADSTDINIYLKQSSKNSIGIDPKESKETEIAKYDTLATKNNTKNRVKKVSKKEDAETQEAINSILNGTDENSNSYYDN
ncbi:MAG: hypothetical protein ABGW97_09780 [Christiangramia sp.]|uniref:hypothetical protein n=1 Tax=Christiangramia sp. TaxID=1931228 RepID=UPI003242D454